MGIRDKLAVNSLHLLRRGENVQEVLTAQATSPWWNLATWLVTVLANSNRVLVVTDQRILVCQGGRYQRLAISGVLYERPRSTKFGDPKGLWYRTDSFGEKLWIPFLFFKDVRRADAVSSPPAADASSAQPS